MTTIAKLKDIVDKSKIYQLYQNINNHPLKIDQLNMNEMVEFIWLNGMVEFIWLNEMIESIC